MERLGGHVDRVFIAGPARAYKPSGRLFEHAFFSLGVRRNRVVHICASPALDHVAARDQKFRCIWIDRGNCRKKLSDCTADATLPSLAGLPDLFASLDWMQLR